MRHEMQSIIATKAKLQEGRVCNGIYELPVDEKKRNCEELLERCMMYDLK